MMLCFAATSRSFGQASQLWVTYNLQARLHPQWSLMADANHRVQSFERFNAVVTAFRMGGMYHLNDRKHLAGGYAWFSTHVAGRSGALLQEHRLWQQFQVAKPLGKGALNHRFRLEQRMRELSIAQSGRHYFSVRARYMASWMFPLIAPQKGRPGLTLQVADEIMVHEGEGIRLLLDQNRVITGLHVAASRSLSIAALYQLTHQYQLVTDVINPLHVLRLTVTHTPDWQGKQ